MIRTLLVAMLALLLSMPAFAAEEKEKEKSFWDMLRSKIEKVTPTKKAKVTTAVGGVRGAKNEAGSELYWKGKDQEIEVSEEELDLFNRAMDEAFAGNNDAAIGLFESFVSSYPESLLHEDSLLALKHLRSK